MLHNYKFGVTAGVAMPVCGLPKRCELLTLSKKHIGTGIAGMRRTAAFPFHVTSYDSMPTWLFCEGR